MADSTSLNVLIVEDDPVLASLLTEQLATFGHRSALAADGRSALSAITRDAFDVVVLDRMLPVLNGIAVLEHLRQGAVLLPVIMLTALGQTVERVEGLEAGADDYVVKPVDPIELNARLRAVVRARRYASDSSETIRVGDILISPTKLRAWRKDRDLDLPRTEFNLLLELARNAGSVLTRPMLIERVWRYDFEPTTNIVDAYIRRLRVKLTQFGDDDPITTLRGFGYMLGAD
ncbi:MAG: response regulator transcription factor [Sphingobium sp.]|nr:response regulator transcription factor [Sphingobium sp.]